MQPTPPYRAFHKVRVPSSAKSRSLCQTFDLVAQSGRTFNFTQLKTKGRVKEILCKRARAQVSLGKALEETLAFHIGVPMGTVGTVSVSFLEPSQALAAQSLPSPHISQLHYAMSQLLCCYNSFQRKYKCNAFSPE